MVRRCTACGHPDRDQIDQVIVSGAPLRRIAADFGLSETALRRHAAEHVPAKLRLAAAANEATEAGRLLAELVSLKSRALSLLSEAERSGDLAASARLIREARATIEVLLEVRGAIDRTPQLTLNLSVSAEWIELRQVILTTLDHYPEAQQAIVTALSARTGSGHHVDD